MLSLSLSLFWIGLWQIEMLWVQFQNRDVWELDAFVLPFGFTVCWWVARDVWYAIVVLSYAILLWLLWR